MKPIGLSEEEIEALVERYAAEEIDSPEELAAEAARLQRKRIVEALIQRALQCKAQGAGAVHDALCNFADHLEGRSDG